MKLTARFFEACANGEIDVLRDMLADDPEMARVSNPDEPHQGWTGLHTAARSGQLQAVKLLLEHGADPNAREAGDNTYPLHWAAAHNHLDVVRSLLDSGGDVHGIGDVHQLDTIGWASFYHAPGDAPGQMDASRRALVELLVERGAKHHIFSAICVGDLALIREVVKQNPAALERRMSRFEGGRTPLDFALGRKRRDIVDLLIELGVKPPRTTTVAEFQAGMAKLAESVKKNVPMIYVPDIARALNWYMSIGFKELGRYEDNGVVNFGIVSFGNAELMLNIAEKRGSKADGEPTAHDVSLWFYTDRIDDLYQLLKSRQLAEAGIEFEQDLEQMFYGARQFCIRDLNGYQLYFIQSDTD